MISNAIKRAPSEHVVYFLLTSYLDARASDDHASALPAHVKRLPIAGTTDVHERLRALSDACGGEPANAANVSPILHEAVDVLRAASERIVCLQSPERSAKSWNVIDRSKGGHVRRRRLVARMTDREAAEWSAEKGVQLESTDEPLR